MRFNCRAILFDLDGVLVDSREVVERHWRQWAEGQGIDFDRVRSVLHGRRSEEIILIVAPELDAATEAQKRDTPEAMDTRGLRTFTRAADLLRSIPAGPWAVVTSGNAKTAAMRLTYAAFPKPNVLVTADDVTRGKPHPDPYLLAAKRLEVEARNCVVVEDAPAGLSAGRAAGMRVIAVATTHEQSQLAEADAIVADVNHLHVSTLRNELLIDTRGQP